jgi:ATP-dependent protease ClpP protease subunit
MPGEYAEVCYNLSKAYTEDTFTFHINNGGGVVDSAFMIADAMKKSKATVHGKLSGTVASASTVLTLACDTIEIAPFTQFMIHNYFHGAQGTGNQVKEYVNFTDSEFIKTTKIVYAGFMTPNEMSQVSGDDKELWMNATEVIARWEARKKGDTKALEAIEADRKAK